MATGGSRELKCNLCQTSVQPTSWYQHLAGKKHLKNLALQTQRDNSDDRTVFVTGFVKGTTELQLANCLGKIEIVTNVRIDTLSGTFAFVELEDKSAVDRMIASGTHELNGKPLKLEVRSKRPLKPKPKAAKAKKKKVNLPMGLSDLERTVTRQLCEQKSVDEQVLHLITLMSLDSVDYALRDQLRSLLECLFREFFPECTVTPYGSSASNLGRKQSSDLDLFVDVGFESSENEKISEMTFSRIINKLPYIRLGGDPTFLTEIKKLTRKALIRLVGIIVRRFANGCVNIFTLTTARCPIVQFVHEKSGLRCDISLKNRLALMNTELIVLYQKLDPRVRPLIFAIRYWGKNAGVTFSNMSRLSSYAITMMVVFYLQNCVPPVLPTVEHLQFLTDDYEMIDNWICHFCRDPERIARTGNPDSLETLLKGFFRFYAKMDFGSMVLCLRNGKIVPLDEFLMTSEYDLKKFKKFIHIQDPFDLAHNIAGSASKECALYFVALIARAQELSLKWNDLNQDGDGPIQFWGLAAVFNDIDQFDPKSALKSFAKNNTAANTKLTKLTSAQGAANIKIDEGEFDVTLSDNVVYLSLKCSKPVSEITVEEENFLRLRLATKIEDVFSKALLFDCHKIVPDDNVSDSLRSAPAVEIVQLPGNKRHRSDDNHNDGSESITSPSKVRIVQKENGQVQIQDSNVATIFECTVHHRTWMNRKSARSEMAMSGVQPKASLLDTETAISNHIIRTHPSQTAKSPIFKFICELHPIQTTAAKNKIALKVKLSSNCGLNEFKGVLVSFLNSYLQKIVNQTFVM